MIAAAAPVRLDAERSPVMTKIVRPPSRRRPRHEYRCAACAYGAVAHVPPRRCPRCGGSVWEHEPDPDRAPRSLRSVP